MIEHPGPSFLLSAFLVVGAALILYRPEPEPSVVVADPATNEPASVVASEPPPKVEPPEVEPPVEPTAGKAWPGGRDPSPPEPAPPREATEPARRSNTRRPIDSPFASVQPGETITDVARRVYGSEAEAPRLWSANRDVVPALDAILEPGTVLRTPKAEPEAIDSSDRD